MKDQEISIESLCASESFQRYCMDVSPKDVAYWTEWLEENPHYEDIFEAAKKLIQQLSFQLTEDEIAEEFHDLKAQLSTRSIPEKTMWNTSLLLKVAATFLFLIVGVWLWNTLHQEEYIEFATQYGNTQTISLPDSSKVILNANSKLRYLSNWNTKDKRSIWLEGEAYFEVVNNNNQAFIVHTKKGEVQVLGTSFNVFQRSEDFSVALVEGKVQLALPNKTKLNMNPGDQVVVKKNTIDQRKADVDLITAWRLGKLIFKNETIKSIINRLQYEYGWQIEVKDATLLKRKVNATGLKNKPEVLLEALAEIYELDIQKLGEGIYEIN